MAEALLPGTDAIPRATVEWSSYRGRQLVRLRSLHGRIARQQQFDTVDEAAICFWEWAYLLQAEAKAAVAEERRQAAVEMGAVA